MQMAQVSMELERVTDSINPDQVAKIKKAKKRVQSRKLRCTTLNLGQNISRLDRPRAA